MGARTCHQCGGILTAANRFCPECGAPADGSDTTAMQHPDQIKTMVLSTTSAAPSVHLQLRDADGAVHQLEVGETYIGRVETNDLVVDRPGISRQHARIVTSASQAVLEDLNSTNGTYLNGERVTALAPLTDGDVVTLGDIPLHVALRAAAPPVLATGGAPPQPAVMRQETIATRLDRGGLPGRAARAERIIGLNQVQKTYRSGDGVITILNGITLEIGKGEFVALIGPSGCGKTTTLNVIIGIDRPDSGEIFVGDQAIHRMSENQMARWRGRNIGVVFQFFQLLPTLTVVENVMMPMHFTKTYQKRERRDRAMELLKAVDMEERANRLPSALSGGQQQRVAIARALACDPPILVADEPTGNLDSKTSQQVFRMLMDLNSQGKTIVMVTHDPVLARSIPRRIEMLDGEIVG